MSLNKPTIALLILIIPLIFVFLNIRTSSKTNTGTIIQIPTQTIEEYRACGCGCCGGTEDSAEIVCLDKDRGETLEEVMRKDRETRNKDFCKVAGCTIGGTIYRYCDT